ncbi:hypothetical protein F5144DRAFT_352412 [Chaetomium tenue]|uniref:Uncharacterized protein n=1 Tax=Chaetomium tenue TaxID=1854479 RepID=A0ACB7P365_9PEZI|nr:hypothetical protein F5144DRAFT_352412 [Chaetomium globosum]
MVPGIRFTFFVGVLILEHARAIPRAQTRPTVRGPGAFQTVPDDKVPGHLPRGLLARPNPRAVKALIRLTARYFQPVHSFEPRDMLCLLHSYSAVRGIPSTLIPHKTHCYTHNPVFCNACHESSAKP